ncbi:MAG: hypothetical protein AAGE98_17480, partial [Actinomycetota bacterium]
TYGWTCHGDRGRTWTTDRRPDVEELSDDTVAELRRLNVLDLEVYGEARAKVAGRTQRPPTHALTPATS